MKKFFFAIAVLVAAIASYAFSNPFSQENESQDEVIYRYDGAPTQTEFEDETNWVEVANTDGLGCGATGNICYIVYLDQANSVHPPTLPEEFDPYLLDEYATKGE